MLVEERAEQQRLLVNGQSLHEIMYRKNFIMGGNKACNPETIHEFQHSVPMESPLTPRPAAGIQPYHIPLRSPSMRMTEAERRKQKKNTYSSTERKREREGCKDEGMCCLILF